MHGARGRRDQVGPPRGARGGRAAHRRLTGRSGPARPTPAPGRGAARLIAAAAFLLAVVPRPAAAVVAVAPAAEALEVTRKVQARYDATDTFSSPFEQEIRIEAGGQVIRSSGQVAFKRPGRMNWRYEAPEPQTIVADGKSLWIYQPEDHQVLKAPLRDAFESRTPVSFLLGVARIEEDFEPSLLAPAADGSVRLKLLPKSDPQGQLGALTLELEPVTFDIRAAIVQDSLGNTTRVSLRDLRRNVPVDDGLFRFEVPYGADVIEAPGR